MNAYTQMNPARRRTTIFTKYALHAVALLCATAPLAAQGLGRSSAIGDFDFDGNADVVVGTGSSIQVFPGTSNGPSTTGRSISWGNLRFVELPEYRNTNLVCVNCPSSVSFGRSFGSTLAVGRLNSDVYDDLVIGAPESSDRSELYASCGVIVVLYGSSRGLDTSRAECWSQDSRVSNQWANGKSEGGDRFGAALAVGDLTGDGIDDIAIGVPGEDSSSGVVNVMRGSASGITLVNDWIWDQDSPNAPGGKESGDLFGSALAIGRFEGPSRLASLAVGVPGEDLSNNKIPGAGAVSIFTNGGGARQMWYQGSSLNDAPEPYDRFGCALAVGDFNGDLYDDLAIGVYGQDIGSARSAGAVHVIYSGGYKSPKLGAANNMIIQQYSSVRLSGAVLVPWGGAESSDRFGFALAAGDLDGDRRDDLVVGTPYEHIGSSLHDAGIFQIIYGSSGSRLNSGRTETFTQSRPHRGLRLNALQGSQTNDRYGWSLAIGQLDSTRAEELLVGVPYERSGRCVHFLRGTSNGLSSTGSNRLR